MAFGKNTYKRFGKTVAISAMLSSSALCQTDSPNPPPTSEVALAFKSMFYPASAPKVRTMGTIQRTNFLEELLNNGGRFQADERNRLQVVFVIDGTESMSEELAGIKQILPTMVEDLRRIVKDRLDVQLVVYRDAGSNSGPISWPLKIRKDSWATDDKVIMDGFAELAPESGAPYFYEQVDAGLHTALSDIAWSEDEGVQKWVFLIGDAPPYQNDFSEPATGAVRQFKAEVIKEIANRKGIRVHALLCKSRESDKVAYEKVLPECRQFFDDITSSTGGLLLDLSDAEVSARIREAAEAATKKIVELAPITQQDVESYVRQQDPIEKKSKVAVLPFLDSQRMDFSPSNEMAQLAEEIRDELDRSGVETRRKREVEVAFNRAKKRVKESEIAQWIGQSLEVDYIIWGKPSKDSAESFLAEVIDVRTGKPIATSDAISPKRIATATAKSKFAPINVRLCSQVIQSLATKSKAIANKSDSSNLTRMFSGQLKTRLVSTADSESNAKVIQEARLRLQEALASTAFEKESLASIKKAEALLQGVKDEEASNPLWQNLMANTYFGLYLQQKLEGKDRVEARRLLQLARLHATRAHKELPTDKEYEADNLFFQGELMRSIPIYESIAKESVSSDAAARAHWMLFFLYLGDWKAVETNNDAVRVDVKKARDNALILFASYPNSEETKALKKALHWSDENQRTNLPFMAVEDASPSDQPENTTPANGPATR